jgi:serine protease Do
MGSMRRTAWSVQGVRRFAGMLLVMAGITVTSTTPSVAVVPETFADVVDRVAPSVVYITTARTSAPVRRGFPSPEAPEGFEEFFRDFFERGPQQAPRPGNAVGAGFVISPDGYVVTNNHVIAEADEITVVFSDESRYEAELIGTDTKTDIALLKIGSERPLPIVEFANSDQVRVGDWVIAIGNPYGLGHSVTAGIVSAIGRDINAGPYDDFFQIDAPINRGNSGGPSFNLEGQVIGINTAIFSPSGGNVGIGFTIPANLAVPVIDSLKRSGRVERGWLGVRIQTVTEEIAESLGLDATEGALVASVTPDGPAEEAAIEPGDVIIEFDGKQIDRMRGLPRIVAETPVGKAVEVIVWRRGERVPVEVELGELPDEEEIAALSQEGADAPPVASLDTLGFTVATLDDELRARFELEPDVEGVVIVDVTEGGPASEESLRPGDVIREVTQEEVASPADVVAKVEQAREADKRSVLMLVDRGGDLRFVALRFGAG